MNNFSSSIIILNRRKKQVLDELEEAKSTLFIWSKRVKLSKENNRIDLLKEASFQEKKYINQVKSLESQLSQLSAEIDKYEKRQSDLDLSAFHQMEEKMPEIEEKKAEKLDVENNDNSKSSENIWTCFDFTLEKQLDIEEEITLIKNNLQNAMSALEKLEFKVLKYKENEIRFNQMNIDEELEDLKKQLKGL